MKSIWFYILGAVLLIALGFYFGRQTNDKVKIEYIKGETVIDTVVISDPIYVEVPLKPKYIIKYDTVVIDNIRYISEQIDTTAIIQDYIVTRTYAFNVFNNDTLGKFDVRQKVGYNKLLSFDYTFTPMTRQITHFKEPVFTPFITGGYSTDNSFLLGGGLYYKHIGIEYLMNVTTRDQIFSWQVDDPIIFNRLNKNEVYHTFKLNYKF